MFLQFTEKMNRQIEILKSNNKEGNPLVIYASRMPKIL